MDTRRARLTGEERSELNKLLDQMEDAAPGDVLLAQFGALMAKTDAYDPFPGRALPLRVTCRYSRGSGRKQPR